MVKVPEIKVPEQFAELNKASIETALRFAKISMDGAEKLIRLQLEAAKAAIEDSAKNAQALTQVKDVQEAMLLRTKMNEASIESAMSYSKGVYDVAHQTQAQLAKLVEDGLQAMGKDVMGAMDKATSNAPAGSDFAVAALKSSVAAASATFDAMTKAAKQLGEVSDASMRAAAATATDAVKKTTGKK